MAKRTAIEGSRCLIDEDPLLVLPSLAVAIGLNEAILLQQIHFWMIRRPHERDGKLWVYNTYEQWRLQCPFWSTKTIGRAMVSLEEQGAIVTANFNHNPIDKTKWYTIDYKKVNELCARSTGQDGSSTGQDGSSTGQDGSSTGQDGSSTGQDGTMDDPSCPHHYQETNPEITPREENPLPLSGESPAHEATRGQEETDVPETSTQQRRSRPDTILARRAANEVLQYLNAVHQRTFEITTEIEAILRRGKTQEQCRLVIDWLWAVDRLENAEGYERHFNSVMPFRPKNWDRLYDRAVRWQTTGRASPATPGVDLTAKEMRTVMNAVAVAKEIMDGPRGQPPILQIVGGNGPDLLR